MGYSSAQTEGAEAGNVGREESEPRGTKRTHRRWIAALVFVAGLVAGAGLSTLGYFVGRDSAGNGRLVPYVASPAPSGRPASVSSLSAVVQAVEPAVVNIGTVGSQGLFATAAAGTGMVVSPDGFVLTNAHVVAGANSISVGVPGKGTFQATVTGLDAADDVAVIKLQGVSGLPTVVLGDSSSVKVGDPVIAIGNALDLGSSPTVTTGIVSALNRSISTDTESLNGLIQTDAPLNPGNSGGPLLNYSGQVIGMNTAVASGSQGIGFAIPINRVKELIPSLEQGRVPSAPSTGGYLGVAVQDTFGGVSVIQVQPNSPAERAGIQPGDTIVAVDSTPITSSDQLAQVISGDKPGQRVQIQLRRGGQTITVTATLASRPAT
jgi:S1-C subfamily serine protease